MGKSRGRAGFRPSWIQGLVGPGSFPCFGSAPLCCFPSEAGSHHVAATNSSGPKFCWFTDPGERSTPFLRKVAAKVVALIGLTWCPSEHEPITDGVMGLFAVLSLANSWSRILFWSEACPNHRNRGRGIRKM